jgi:hypothetical protein
MSKVWRMSTHVANWGTFKRWDFWFGLVGVFGSLFAIYGYVVSNKVGRISYTIETQKVFDPANLSGFTLITPENAPVKKVVYATELVIWNSGDFSLGEGSDRIREPLQIRLNGVAYYFLLGKTNLVDASNYQIAMLEDRSGVTIRWHFLDPGQGFRLTLLHSDATDPNVTLSGRFLDTVIQSAPVQRDGGITTRMLAWFSLAMGIGGAVAVMIKWRRLYRSSLLANTSSLRS